MNLPSGADKRAEADDPMELVGVTYAVGSPEEADRELARCFVEEYALMGWDAERIRRLFLNPLYGGPHAIATRRGKGFVDEVVRTVFRPEES